MNLDALRDTLNFCAASVSEASSGYMTPAIVSWNSALEASHCACAGDSPEGGALAVIIEASGPSFATDTDRDDLCAALNAAALVLVPALCGDTDNAGDALLEASWLASKLTGWNEHFRVILTAAWDATIAEVPA
jgi:hypothetical protein